MTAEASPRTGAIATHAASLPRPRRELTRGAAFAGTSLAAVGLYLASGAPTPILLLLQQEWGFPSWALTIAFGSYAFGLIAALLVAGKLSDHVGRRPVIAAALAVQVVAMVGFAFAPSIGWVIAARTLQGIATGAATSALTASIVELAPARFTRLGSIIGGTAPAAGLALGALFAGFAVQFSAEADAVVFTVLAVVSAVGLLVALLSPETSTRRPGALRSLVPRVAVPSPARREFAASIPAMIAAWMLAALFLGLGPMIVLRVFHIDSGAVNGVVAFSEPAAAALAGFLLGRVAVRRVLGLAGIAVLIGTAVIVLGVVTGSLPLFVLGGIAGGVGFGGALSGALRMLTPLVQAHERAGLFAAVYAVAYLSFGVPAILGGLLIAPLGLTVTSLVYAAVIVLASTAGVVAQVRAAARERTAARREASGCPASDCAATA